MNTEQTILKNGLRIITAERPQNETVSLGLWVNTGSAYEQKENNGVSHFVEHMVFKGTEKRDALQISEEIENVGGQSNAYTSREFTAFYAKMLKNDTELALDVLADFLMAPTFPEDEIKKEREVVVQEIKQSIDTPDDAIFDYFQETAFPNQPLGRTILGPAETVRSFTPDILRTYMKHNYAAENTVAVAVGNIKHADFVKMVEDRLANYQAKKDFTPAKQTYQGGFYEQKRSIEQAQMVLGFEGVPYYNTSYYALSVFSTLFGGGMSSRLFQEIREKRGLVYTVYSFMNAHTQNGLFGIYAGTSADELNKLMPVVADEIKKVVQEKVSTKELERAKVQLKASMLMALESTSSSAEVIARQMLLYNRVIPTKETVERLESVTMEDVQNIARQIFSKNPTYTLLGDLKEYPTFEKLQSYLKF